MKSYEAMFIFKPGLAEEEQKSLIGQMEKMLQENQTKIIDRHELGRRQLAYPINKYNEGFYYQINFSTANGTVIANLKRACIINENVLRALIIKK